MSIPELKILSIKPTKNMESGGFNDDMEQRVKTLETTLTDVRDRLVRVEARLEYGATREDVARIESSIIKWLLASAAALSSLAFAAARWMR